MSPESCYYTSLVQVVSVPTCVFVSAAKRKKAILSDSEDEDEEKEDKPGEDKRFSHKKFSSNPESIPEPQNRFVPFLPCVSAAKRSRAVSDDENSGSDDGGSVGPDRSLAAKLRELGSDSGSDEEDRAKPGAPKKDEKGLFGSDSESGEDEEE